MDFHRDAITILLESEATAAFRDRCNRFHQVQGSVGWRQHERFHGSAFSLPRKDEG